MNQMPNVPVKKKNVTPLHEMRYTNKPPFDVDHRGVEKRVCGECVSDYIYNYG